VNRKLGWFLKFPVTNHKSPITPHCSLFSNHEFQFRFTTHEPRLTSFNHREHRGM